MTSGITLSPSQLQVGSVGATVVNAARSQIGVTYAWGGGTKDGPSQGIRDGGVADSFGDYKKIGFDCSGLTLYSWGKAGVTLPRVSRDQYAACTKIPDSALQAGDLVFWGNPVHHVAIWSGQNKTIIEALESGTTVREVPMRFGGDYRGAGRPVGGTITSLLGDVVNAVGDITGGAASSVAGGITNAALKQYAPYIALAAIAIIGAVIVFTAAGNE